MQFNIPRDYRPPEGVEEGKPFKEIVTLQFEKGKITLIAIGQDNIPIKSNPKSGRQAIIEAVKEEENVDF